MSHKLPVPHANEWNPWKEIAAMQAKMNGWLTDLATPSRVMESPTANFFPACDVEESDRAYLITVDVPGIPKENLKLEAHGDRLHVSGEHADEKHEKKGKRRISERVQGKFERTFHLHGMENAEKIDAHYRDGVLKILVPKAVTSPARQIPIAEAKGDRETRKRADHGVVKYSDSHVA